MCGNWLSSSKIYILLFAMLAMPDKLLEHIEIGLMSLCKISRMLSWNLLWYPCLPSNGTLCCCIGQHWYVARFHVERCAHVLTEAKCRPSLWSTCAQVSFALYIFYFCFTQQNLPNFLLNTANLATPFLKFKAADKRRVSKPWSIDQG